MVTKPLILVYSMLDLRVDSFGFHAEMSRTGKFVAEPAWWEKKDICGFILAIGPEILPNVKMV